MLEKFKDNIAGSLVTIIFTIFIALVTSAYETGEATGGIKTDIINIHQDIMLDRQTFMKFGDNQRLDNINLNNKIDANFDKLLTRFDNQNAQLNALNAKIDVLTAQNKKKF